MQSVKHHVVKKTDTPLATEWTSHDPAERGDPL
jgi:hypothetical protein